MFRDGIVKNKSIKKMIKKQQLNELGPNLTQKLNENKCLGVELDKNKLIKKMIRKKINKN